MILDTNKIDSLDNSVIYDVCIAGGGVAGIVLAKALAEKKKKVLLLEAGGLEYSGISQAVYKGQITGHDYFPLTTTRLRYLGGSSNHWAGWCRPLDPYDFKEKNYMGWSGWPISHEDLSPFLIETINILDLDKTKLFSRKNETIEDSGGEFKNIRFQFSKPPVRFKDKYMALLESSEYIDLYIHANLTDIQNSSAGSYVSSLVFTGYSDNNKSFHARASNYILALGGIENAKVLLNSSRSTTNRVLNENDLVGRFFMEHPTYTIGPYVAIDKPYYGRGRRKLAPTAEFIYKHKIGNFNFRHSPPLSTVVSYQPYKNRLKHKLCENEVIRDFIKVIKPSFECNSPWYHAGLLDISCEQAPNFNSRVQLASEKDRFGLYRTSLNWQLLPIDKNTIRTAALEFAKYFARNGHGRIKIDNWILDEDAVFPSFVDGHEMAGNHHMGTTRMGATPRTAVTDKNCKVFGVDNLYIAGSSVFCTCGHANPTFTIVQLSLRLAKHLSS